MAATENAEPVQNLAGEATPEEVELAYRAIERAKAQLVGPECTLADMFDGETLGTVLSVLVKHRGRLNYPLTYLVQTARNDFRHRIRREKEREHRLLMREKDRLRGRNEVFLESGIATKSSRCSRSKTEVESDVVQSAIRNELTERIASLTLPPRSEKILRALYFDAEGGPIVKRFAGQAKVTRQTVKRWRDRLLTQLRPRLGGFRE